MSRNRRRLGPEHIAGGRPLPCDLFDAAGHLLFREGHLVASDALAQRLLELGVYGDPEAGREQETPADPRVATSVFSTLQALRRTVAECLAAVTPAQRLDATVVGKCARELATLCARDPDATLGTILLQRDPPYATRQMVNAAIVTELLLAPLILAPEARHPVLSAALTMNMAMIGLQEILYGQKEDLTGSQREHIRRHPLEAVRMLQAAGVVDTVWLECVAQHHEAPDGSGYPEHLQGGAICLGAQVLAIADRYCAMISERSYRPGAFANVALRLIFLSQGKSVDTMLAASLVREVGLYPPGTLVQLANGEVAISIKRTLHASQPVVRAILNASGIPLPAMPKRLTSQPSHEIVQVLPPGRLPASVDLNRLWIPGFDPLTHESIDDPGLG